MENGSERQLHEPVQKALTFPQVKETTAQQLDAVKALFLQKKDTFSVLMGMENPLKYFKLAIMELQVKELRKADVKACCLHDELESLRFPQRGQQRELHNSFLCFPSKKTNRKNQP